MTRYEELREIVENVTDLQLAFLNRDIDIAILDCIRWHGGYTGNGYGVVVVNGRRWPAHRIAWEIYHRRTLPKGHVVHHLCGSKWCVNPVCLRAVTQTELLNGPNGANRSANSITRRKSEQTHCLRGHEFTDANTQLRTNGSRKCRACARQRYHERKKLETVKFAMCPDPK